MQQQANHPANLTPSRWVQIERYVALFSIVSLLLNEDSLHSSLSSAPINSILDTDLLGQTLNAYEPMFQDVTAGLITCLESKWLPYVGCALYVYQHRADVYQGVQGMLTRGVGLFASLTAALNNPNAAQLRPNP